MLIKTKAIVLHSFRYGEQQLITDFLTPEEGRVSCITKLQRSPKARLRRQYFQPLTILDAVMDISSKPGLQHIREAAMPSPFRTLPFDPLKLSLSLFIAEFLRAVTRREPVSAAMYEYIESSICWLDACPGSFSNFHIVFMMRLTLFLGFHPNTSGGTPSSWFDLRSGCFTGNCPLHRDALPPAEASHVSQLMRMNFSTMHLYHMSHQDRNRLTEIIIKYYRLHLPDMPELKSLAVLKELF